jgi:glutathione S-transferase
MSAAALTVVGRTSSSFTRVVRIFALELNVPYGFEIVRNIQSLDPGDYGGNPGLKLPSLRSAEGSWFGALNVCRELARISEQRLRIIWPEQLTLPLLANAQELVLQGMSTEVGLIMSSVAEQPLETVHRAKMTKSLAGTLSWLDANIEPALLALPRERDLSYLEVTLFCLVAHLDFRKVLPTAPYAALGDFRRAFGQRAACRDTEYHFDA